jgi:hypothetical protein
MYATEYKRKFLVVIDETPNASGRSPLPPTASSAPAARWY